MGMDFPRALYEIHTAHDSFWRQSSITSPVDFQVLSSRNRREGLRAFSDVWEALVSASCGRLHQAFTEARLLVAEALSAERALEMPLAPDRQYGSYQPPVLEHQSTTTSSCRQSD